MCKLLPPSSSSSSSSSFFFSLSLFRELAASFRVLLFPFLVASGLKMMFGKRARQPMKRTTSMTEFTLDLNTSTTTPNNVGEPQPPMDHSPFGDVFSHHHHHQQQQFLAAGVSPRNQRRNSVDFVQMTTPDFLRSCALCKRRLVPGRDIYMYRGDSAFCSSECRQQQMKQDERKEKCSVMVSKKSASSPSKAAGAEVANVNGETIAAV